MNVECAQCHQAYNIPDERLPQGKKVTFPCPACKHSISIDLRSPAEEMDGIMNEVIESVDKIADEIHGE